MSRPNPFESSSASDREAPRHRGRRRVVGTLSACAVAAGLVAGCSQSDSTEPSDVATDTTVGEVMDAMIDTATGQGGRQERQAPTGVNADNYEEKTGVRLVDAFDAQYAAGSQGDCFAESPFDPIRTDGDEAILRRWGGPSTRFSLMVSDFDNPVFRIEDDGRIVPDNHTAQAAVTDYGCEFDN